MWWAPKSGRSRLERSRCVLFDLGALKTKQGHQRRQAGLSKSLWCHLSRIGRRSRSAEVEGGSPGWFERRCSRRPETELGSAANGDPTNLNTKTGVSRPATREESGETKEERREEADRGPLPR